MNYKIINKTILTILIRYPVQISVNWSSVIIYLQKKYLFIYNTHHYMATHPGKNTKVALGKLSL